MTRSPSTLVTTRPAGNDLTIDRSVAGMSIPGALAFVVCLVGFTAIAWLVSQPGIPPVDTAATTFLHGLANPTLDALMATLTGLGSSEVLASITGLAAVLLAVRRRRAEAVFVILALVGTLLLTDALKLVVHRPRPGFDWAEVWPEYSFPSGHAMHSFVVYFAIALVIWRLKGRGVGVVTVALATVLAVGIVISRIYPGAHWLSDVLGGYLAGAL